MDGLKFVATLVLVHTILLWPAQFKLDNTRVWQLHNTTRFENTRDLGCVRRER